MTNAGAFQAIVRKEMREHFAWAVLGLMLTSVVLISSLPSEAGPTGAGIPIVRLQLAPNVDTIGVFSITLTAAVVGLMLGRAVVISENRADSWGFLAHRPVSRSTLFWAKAVAGLLLYLGAVAIPTLCIAGWLAMPGRIVPPFDWRMTLPAIADIACGGIFLFAGMLAAMRDARWYASRALGVGVGVICGQMIVGIQSFWSAIACCATGILVAAGAAWGTFLTGGSYSSQPRVSRIAVGLSIASGLFVIGFLGIFLMGFDISSNRQTSLPSSRWGLAKDGSIVKVVLKGDDVVAVDDLQGNPIEKYRDVTEQKDVFKGVVTVSVSLDPGQRDVPSEFDSGYRTTADIYTELKSVDTHTKPDPLVSRWYYVRRLGLIAGYAPKSRLPMGWLGPDGYSPGESLPANRFSGELRSYESYGAGIPLIAFSDAAYRVDLYARSILKVFAAPRGESITGAGSSWNFVFATTKKLYVQSMDGKLNLAIPRDPQVTAYGKVQLLVAAEAPERPMFLWFLAADTDPYFSEAITMPQIVIPVHLDGTLGTRVTLPALLTQDEMQARKLNVDIGAVVLNHPLKALVTLNVLELRLFGFPGSTFTRAQWISIATVITAGLLIAGIVFIKGRRNAFTSGQLRTWTIIGFLLGPIGLALMYSLIEWPVKETCPSCKRKRVVTRQFCEHCGNSFAQPQADGTEIFEPLTQ